MHDKVKVTLVSGKGGDGAIAFRREKSIEYGGPYGGNGGKGGSIYIVADNGIDTLSAYRFGKTFRAQDGENGKTKLQYGRDGKDVTLYVPVGTVVEDVEGNKLADLYRHGDRYLAVKGGRGGRGNAAFKSPIRRTPNVAENGMPAEAKEFYFELKLIADVGIVGLPNAGKSTFLTAISNARPAIGDYPFTTLEPMLGVYQSEDENLVFADIPGLIEGASEGRGLGITFLRHVERCKFLLHLIDASSDLDLYENYQLINKELFAYSKNLRDKKMIVALNKVDLVEDESKIKEFQAKLAPQKVYVISAKNAEGTKRLCEDLLKTYRKIKSEERQNIKKEDEEEKVYTARNDDSGKVPVYQVVKRKDGSFEIVGERVIRTKKLINTKTDEGIDRLLSYLDRIGIDEKLKEAGAKSGDTIVLDDFEFEYFE